MSCSKKYGPGKLLIAREVTPGQLVDLDAEQAIAAQSTNFGALTREVIDNTALRTNRGTNNEFEGAQSEITWDCSVTIPKTTPTNGPLADLLWGAGFNADGKLEPGTICSRTLQLVRQDRDGMLVEILSGCIVSQVEITFSTSDMPVMNFSGVARSKIELLGQPKGQSYAVEGGSVDFLGEGTVARSSQWLMGSATAGETIEVPANIGVTVLASTAGATYPASITDSEILTYSLKVGFDDPSTEATTVDGFLFNLPGDPVVGTPVTTSEWHVMYDASTNFWKDIAASSFSLTVETGHSYGEMTCNDVFPTEMLSGTCKITGSVSMYLDREVESFIGKNFVPLRLFLTPGTTGLRFTFGSVRITERPAYELSVDDAASGDVSFSANSSSTTTFDSLAIYQTA